MNYHEDAIKDIMGTEQIYHLQVKGSKKGASKWLCIDGQAVMEIAHSMKTMKERNDASDKGFIVLFNTEGVPVGNLIRERPSHQTKGTFEADWKGRKIDIDGETITANFKRWL
jgi:hypothetical protein